MDSVNAIVARSTSILRRSTDDSTLSPAMLDLLISLMVLIFLSLLLIAALFMIRKLRRNQELKRETLPQYNDAPNNRHSNHQRRLTITATPYGQRQSSIYVYDEKSSMMSNSASSPTSPDEVPEIRLTFPDEQDEAGQPKSGRVVIIRVGETGVGLEPIKDDQLPAYEKETGGRFQSLDMDRMGGLKEKEQYP